MQEPVSLKESDIGPEAEVIKSFEPDNLRKRGYLQFFHHSQKTKLPVRDVTNTIGEGYKTEPYIERKAENYCSSCYQPNINSFIDQDRRYLFLYTRCRSNKLEEYWDLFIVGYILKQRALNLNGRTAVQGPIKLVKFNEACPLNEVASEELRGAKKLEEEDTEKVLEYFDKADNIYQKSVKKIKKMKRNVQKSKVCKDDVSCVPPPEGDNAVGDDSCGC